MFIVAAVLNIAIAAAAAVTAVDDIINVFVAFIFVKIYNVLL